MFSKPKHTKFTKYHKGRVSYNYNFSQNFKFASYGLVALDSSRISSLQIAAAVLAIKRKISRKGIVYTRVFPHIPVTKKPLQVRMGKGKGSVSSFITRVKPGTFLLELSCSHVLLARNAFKIAASKFPIRTAFVIRKI